MSYCKITCFILVLFIIVCYLYLQNNWVEVNDYQIEISNLPISLDGVRIAQVSDTHFPKNAQTAEKLVKIVEKIKPDIIVITGDIVDSNYELNEAMLITFCSGLSNITKTYAISGNHDIWNKDYDKWKKILDKCNVKYLNNSVEIYQKLYIVGLEYGKEDQLKNIIDKYDLYDKPKVVLTHRPEILESYAYALKDISSTIVFAGHAHGGQFRIPFLDRGFIAPDQGYFPSITSGICLSKSGLRMVVSRGLGNSIIPIRINNRPEIPVVKLIAK